MSRRAAFVITLFGSLSASAVAIADPPAPIDAPAPIMAPPPQPAAPSPSGNEPATQGAETAPPASWNDASIHLAWGPTYAEPGVTQANGASANVAKATVSVVYVSGDKLGGNFIEVDYLQSGSVDHAAGSSSGATEIYAILRRDFSLNKVSRSKAFTFFVVRDVGIELGVDANTKSTTFAPAKKMLLLGPTLSLDVPGFWNVGVYVDKEWNHNGLSSDEGRSKTGGAIAYDPTAMLASAWSIPIGKLPFVFEGFASINLPKGKDGFGDATKTEIFAQPKLMWDVTSLWSPELHGVLVGVGYQFWWNKFGNDHEAVPGSVANTLFAEVAVHF